MCNKPAQKKSHFISYKRDMQASCKPSSSWSHPGALQISKSSAFHCTTTAAKDWTPTQALWARYKVVHQRRWCSSLVGSDPSAPRTSATISGLVQSQTTRTSSSRLMKSLAVSPSKKTPRNIDYSQNSLRHPTPLSAAMTYAMSQLCTTTGAHGNISQQSFTWLGLKRQSSSVSSRESPSSTDFASKQVDHKQQVCKHQIAKTNINLALMMTFMALQQAATNKKMAFDLAP